MLGGSLWSSVERFRMSSGRVLRYEDLMEGNGDLDERPDVHIGPDGVVAHLLPRQGQAFIIVSVPLLPRQTTGVSKTRIRFNGRGEMTSVVV